MAVAGATQIVPQTAIMAARSLLLGHFWEAPDVESPMSDIAAMLAISIAMLLACTADKLKLRAIRTARKRATTRLADEWIMGT